MNTCTGICLKKPIAVKRSASFFYEKLLTLTLRNTVSFICGKKQKGCANMLMKIGDVTNKLGISHRSLHYWENVGILQSTRGENNYRYYDEENIRKIKQIVLLRKLRLSIPSIQEIYFSDELSKLIAVFSEHLDATVKEAEQLNALSIILQQLLNILKDKQDINCVYNYLNTMHSTESDQLKEALKTVLTGSVREIAIESPPEPVVDMTDVDLTLESMTAEDIHAVTEVIKQCYAETEDTDKLINAFEFEHQLEIPDCAWCYKIMQNAECVGTVTLSYVGMEAMLIRSLAYMDPDNNVYIFELLKKKHPDILCWNILFPNEDQRQISLITDDYEGKRKQFRDDNNFKFYTAAGGDHYIKLMRPHDEIYNSSRYRFALLDGSMDGVAFRFFGANKLDFYDGRLTQCRITDVNFCEAFIYDTWMDKTRVYDTQIADSAFRYVIFDQSEFSGSSFRNCVLKNCDLTGMTIDGIDVEEALAFYEKRKGRNKNKLG